jgi:addiction module RelE/StbE family toxin
MKYRLIFLPSAKRNLIEITTYLSQYYVSTVRKFKEQLKKQTDKLIDMPFICPQYEEYPFFRRMVIDDYLLFYHIEEERHRVVIHYIFHSSKNISRDILSDQSPD